MRKIPYRVPVLALLVAALQSPPWVRAEPPGSPSATLIEELVNLVRENYVLEERIPAIEKTLREALELGTYEGLADAEALAERLTRDLREASSDLHFGVRARPSDKGGGAKKAETASPPQPLKPQIHGLPRVEVLEGNVGYLEVSAFVDPHVAAGTVDQAFRTLAGTDALLIDVRASRGGHPGMVAYLASYLFGGEAFVLSRIYWRNRGRTLEFSTRTDLPAPRYTEKPVFILTSSSTPSAAEGFTYHLKHFGRATVVGETTAGAAHPIQIFPLGDDFRIAVPTGRAINPRTGTNWEGKGVLPDVPVPAAEARKEAHRLALEALSPGSD